MIILQFPKNPSIEVLEHLYLRSFNFTEDSIYQFKEHTEYSDIKILTLERKKTQFRNPRFTLWKKTRNAANAGDSLYIKLVRQFPKSESSFIKAYYQTLYKIYRNRFNSLKQLKEHISHLDFSNKIVFKRNLFHAFRILLQRQQIFDGRYGSVVSEIYRIDYARQHKYSMFRYYQHIQKFLRVNHLYDYTIPLLVTALNSEPERYDPKYRYYKSFMRYNIVETYSALGNKEKALSYFFKHKKKFSIVPKMATQALMGLKNFSEADLAKIQHKRNKFEVSGLQVFKQFETALSNEDTLKLNSLYKNIIPYSKVYRQMFPFRTLNFYTYLNSSKLDSVYLHCKNEIIKTYKTKLSSNLLNSVFLEESPFTNFISEKVLTNNVTYINDLFLISGYSQHFKNKLLPELNNNSVYSTYTNEKRTAIASMEYSKNFLPFISIFDFHLKERELLKPLIDSIPYTDPLTIDKLQQKLDTNDVILYPLKRFAEPVMVKITSSTVEAVKNEQIYTFLEDVKEKHLYMVNTTYAPRDSFEIQFFKRYKHLPKLQFINSVYEYAPTKTFPLETASFFGTDKAFTLDTTHYSQLHFVEDEEQILSDAISLNRTNDLNSDILHFSGHFVERGHHPYFNKMVMEKAADSVRYLSGYDLIGEKLKGKLVVLNLCKSNTNVNFGTFTGDKSFISFFRNAGAKTILATNSEIDDFTATKLIEQFYLHLFNGVDAAESLRRAKSHIYTHYSKDPKYWATTQLYGENFSVKQASYTWYYILSALLLILVFFIRKRVFLSLR